MKPDLVEIQRTLADMQRRRIRHVHHLVSTSNRCDTVFYCSDILEQCRHFPHDPLRHAVETQHKADTNSHRTNGDRFIHPELDANRTHGKQQNTVSHIECEMEHRDEPHLAMHCTKEAIEAFLDVRLFAA